MATLQLLTDCSTTLKPSLRLNSLLCTPNTRHCRTARVVPRASLNRRHLIAETAAAISLATLIGLYPLFRLPKPTSASCPSGSESTSLLTPALFSSTSPSSLTIPLTTKDGGTTWAPRSIPSAEDEDFNYRFNSISFKGNEGWIVGKPAILLHTSDSGNSWERIPLSAELPGDIVYIKATGEKSAEMVTDEGAIYVTSNRGYNWKAAVQETVSATLNRTVSSGISGASYYTGTFNTVNRSPEGNYVAVSSRGNFYLTWEPGQPYWQPHNRAVARRIQNMGWRADGGLWLLVRGGGLYLSRGTGLTEDFEEIPVQSRGFGILDVGYRSKTYTQTIFIEMMQCFNSDQRKIEDDGGAVVGGDA
ncbi:hypothetical protein RJ639_003233 [Escallonia herrerae]|uniref:Photosynthesis system II assembly factor Ycf48/Hcf136-like domain-containing protein n=1 Tax=Escallonia herrerae TaxID=1293975 RepID=A0AA89B008_9ASTE|nr:hypothetical protein RJ639_003233 [Escallonia herrerae]